MKKITKLILFIIAIIWIWVSINYNNFTKSTLIKEEKVVQVKDWDTLNAVFQKLWVNKIFLKIYFSLNGTPKNLEVGKYILKGGSTFAETIKQLETPQNQDMQVTFLEGWNIYDMDEKLTQMGLIKKGEFVEKIRNNFKNFQQDFDFLASVKTLEGFLYPDTYNINPSSFTLDGIIYKMLKNFQDKVVSELDKKYSSEKLLEIITLASIVEKEEKNKIEKPTVAGILKKRLNENWMIGADATVCYPHKLTSEECKMVVSQYIEEKNGYNTRTMTWLPATPIANPSDETIFATINSEESPYYFYLHGSDGAIHYAVDNAWHEANKMKYLK